MFQHLVGTLFSIYAECRECEFSVVRETGKEKKNLSDRNEKPTNDSLNEEQMKQNESVFAWICETLSSTKDIRKYKKEKIEIVPTT